MHHTCFDSELRRAISYTEGLCISSYGNVNNHQVLYLNVFFNKFSDVDYRKLCNCGYYTPGIVDIPSGMKK